MVTVGGPFRIMDDFRAVNLIMAMEFATCSTIPSGRSARRLALSVGQSMAARLPLDDDVANQMTQNTPFQPISRKLFPNPPQILSIPTFMIHFYGRHRLIRLRNIALPILHHSRFTGQRFDRNPPPSIGRNHQHPDPPSPAIAAAIAAAVAPGTLHSFLWRLTDDATTLAQQLENKSVYWLDTR